jgi:hemerythrin-like domain-containing protein
MVAPYRPGCNRCRQRCVEPSFSASCLGNRSFRTWKPVSGVQPLNIFEALRESHDRQRRYAEILVQTSGDSAERIEAWKQLKAELQAHETAEERFFYIPLMAHDNGIDLSRHAISEHHEMDEMMETLDETEMSSPSWLATAKKLSDKVHHHLKEEEQKFFQAAGKLLDENQKQTLAGQYVKEYEEQLAAA